MTDRYRPPPDRPSPPALSRLVRGGSPPGPPDPYNQYPQDDPSHPPPPQYANRRDAGRAAYNAEYNEMAERRQYARHNPYAPVYDDGMLGQTERNDLRRLDTPVEYDPIIRQEVYSEMGANLRNSLNHVRSRGERHIEQTRPTSRPPSARPQEDARPESGMSIREARQAMTNAQRRFLQEDQQQRLLQEPEEYEADEEGYDYGEERDYVPERRPQRSPYGPVPAISATPLPAPARRRLPDVQPAQQPVRPDGRRVRPPDEQNGGSHRPDPRRPAGRASAPDRFPGNGQAPSPLLNPNSRSSGQTQRVPVAPQVRPSTPQVARQVRPSQPQYLAPDGSIPHNPCGQQLVIDIDNIRHVVECCEESRDPDPTHLAHLNIPHIARINDPRLPRYGVNAFIVWNLDSEVPQP